MKQLQIGSLTCNVAGKNPAHLVYLFFPFDGLEGWATRAAAKYDVTLVSITGMDWDDDLTPWPAPGAPAGSAPFKGLAPEFLQVLKSRVIPQVEEAVTEAYGHPQVIVSDLVGISLSGLFALWQWGECDLFRSVGSISGSFWYPHFADWFVANMKEQKRGKAFFSLGVQEPHTNVPQFRPVGRDTERVVRHLQNLGIEAKFEWVPGNHYSDPTPRLNLCLDFLLG